MCRAGGCPARLGEVAFFEHFSRPRAVPSCHRVRLAAAVGEREFRLMWGNSRLTSTGAPRQARRSSQLLASALTRSVLESIGAPASLARLAGDGPGVRHRTQVPELVGVDQ